VRTTVHRVARSEATAQKTCKVTK